MEENEEILKVDIYATGSAYKFEGSFEQRTGYVGELIPTMNHVWYSLPEEIKAEKEFAKEEWIDIGFEHNFVNYVYDKFTLMADKLPKFIFEGKKEGDIVELTLPFKYDEPDFKYCSYDKVFLSAKKVAYTDLKVQLCLAQTKSCKSDLGTFEEALNKTTVINR